MGRKDRREQQKPQAAPARGSSVGRTFWILAVAGFAAFCLWQYHGASEVVAPPTVKPLARMSARDASQQVSIEGILGGARAGQEIIAKRPSNPNRETPTVYISTAAGSSLHNDPKVYVSNIQGNHPHVAVRLERVRSEGAYRTREEAIADACRVARGRLVDVLRGLQPSIEWLPPDLSIQNEYMLANSVREIAPDADTKARWVANGLESDRIWVELDIEVSEDQLRALRGKQRITSISWYVGGLFAFLLAWLLFVKLDGYTKGYLTYTLLTLAIVASGGIIILVLANG